MPARAAAFRRQFTGRLRHWERGGAAAPINPLFTKAVFQAISTAANFFKENPMAHKKIERKKELDRKRHRREQRLKQRIKEAKAAAKG